MEISILFTLLAFVFMGVFFFFYEKSRISIKEIPLLAAISAIASLGRILCSTIPSVEPVTIIIIITGLVFGSLSGFITGFIVVIVSNIFLGHGHWTIWQMFAWSLCGALAGLLKRLNKAPDIKFLIILSFLWGYVFGWIMNTWYWISFIKPLTIKSFFATNLSFLLFDTIHAITNIIFMVVLGPTLIKVLESFKDKIHISYE